MQIKLKNSVVQDSAPSASDLPEVGELAVNGNINSIGGFMRASDNSIVKIFGPGSVSTPTATTSVSGIAELATNAETTTGSATNRVVTPAGLNAVTVAERATSNSSYMGAAGGTLTGALTMPNGSNSAPAINFGDSDSGIFGGTNTVSLASGGLTGLSLDSSAVVEVPIKLAVNGASKISPLNVRAMTDGNLYIRAITDIASGTGVGIDVLNDANSAVKDLALRSATTIFRNASSESARLDSSGRLLVGTSSSNNVAGFGGSALQVEGLTGATSSMSFIRHSANNVGPAILLSKSRGTSNGATTIVQNNDIVARIFAYGADGTDTESQLAGISYEVDGTPGANDMPGRLVFSTTADGASSSTTRLTIDSAGTSTFAGNITSTKASADNILKIETTTSGDAKLSFNAAGAGGHDIEYIRSSNTLNFKQGGGSVRMSIAANGTVDVAGNLDVGAGIDVTGAITGTGNITTTAGQITCGVVGTSGIQIINDGTFGTLNSIPLTFRTASSPAMTIDTSGRLLLGTTTEGHASADNLTINDSGNGGITIRTGTTSNGAIFFSDATSGTAEYDGYVQYNHGSDPFMQFGVGGSTTMAIKGSNVGIGTTSPSNKLVVNSAAHDDGLFVLAANNNQSTKIRIQGKSSGGTEHNWNLAVPRSADRFGIDNGVNTYLAILDSGNVGIGTTSPQRHFHIHESASATVGLMLTNGATGQSNDSQGFQFKVGSDGTANIDQREDADIIILTNATERMRISSSGQFRAGDESSSDRTSFRHQLSTAANSSACLSLQNPTNSDGQGVVLGFFARNTNNAATKFADITMIADETQANSTQKGSLLFKTNVGASVDERMRIHNNGNVGIGTTSPSSRLEIAHSIGGGGGTGLILNDPGSSGANEGLHIEWRSGTDKQSDQCRIGQSANGTGSGSNLFFATNSSDSGSSTERMRIDSSGNVSIGTTTTSVAKLTIQSMVNSRVHFRAIGDIQSSVAGAGLGLDILNDGGDTVMDLAMRGATTYFRNASGETMRIDSSGAIRSGVTSAIQSEKYSWFRQESDGNTLAYFHQGASANVSGILMRHGRGLSGFSGKMLGFLRNDGTEVGSVVIGNSSTAFNTSSDYRLKENVTSITDGITRLKTLKPYRFNFKDDTTKPVVDGFFAHEVTAVPEAITGTKDEVDSDNNPVYQSIDQSKLVPLLVAAVQELIGKVEALEAA